MKPKNITHLFGCTGVIDKKGILHVHPHLKTFKIPSRSEYPEYSIKRTLKAMNKIKKMFNKNKKRVERIWKAPVGITRKGFPC